MSTTLNLAPLVEASRLGDRVKMVGAIRDLLANLQGFDTAALGSWLERIKAALEWLRGDQGQAAYGFLRTILALFGIELPETLPLAAQGAEWSDDALVAEACSSDGLEAQSIGTVVTLAKLILELLAALRARA